MDEEIDDERKARITRYGSGEHHTPTRRLRHELGMDLKVFIVLFVTFYFRCST